MTQNFFRIKDTASQKGINFFLLKKYVVDRIHMKNTSISSRKKVNMGGQ